MWEKGTPKKSLNLHASIDVWQAYDRVFLPTLITFSFRFSHEQQKKKHKNVNVVFVKKHCGSAMGCFP